MLSSDLSNERCRQWLEFMLAKVPIYCKHNLGWQVSSASCLIRYDDYKFYLNHEQLPSVLVPDPQTITTKKKEILNMKISKEFKNEFLWAEVALVELKLVLIHKSLINVKIL